MLRAGLQQLLAAVDADHVRHVLACRLDRLSRNLGDLILLADKFGESEVSLHSVSENLDPSSAAGRMSYNVLGSFAQYFRGQLSGNVRMGNERAIKEGRWINPTQDRLRLSRRTPGAQYGRATGPCVLPTTRQEPALRAIEERTALKYSTIMAILKSRIYLGEILHNGEWFPGNHETIITQEEWHAAHRGLTKGVQPAKDVLSGRVHCGLCGRRMAIAQNGKGNVTYKCRHRGQGCAQPARSNLGLNQSSSARRVPVRSRRGALTGDPSAVGRGVTDGAREGPPGPPAVGDGDAGNVDR